ncbi:MAG: NUDIX domain-containing protein [bacterium]|nr:NUDIX domain-containing protein [bacterium]
MTSTKEAVRTVGVVLVKGDEVLLVRHTEEADAPVGIYGIPAGKVEKGESLRQAAVRELYEETGLVAREGDLAELPTQYDADIERQNGEYVSMHMTVYQCEFWEGEPHRVKETEPVWVKRGEIYNHKLRPNVDKAIAEAESI